MGRSDTRYQNRYLRANSNTVCHENALEKSNSKFKNMQKLENKRTYPTKLITIGIYVLGLISDLTEFIKFAKLFELRPNSIDFLIFQAIKDSFNIYKYRNSILNWSNWFITVLYND